MPTNEMGGAPGVPEPEPKPSEGGGGATGEPATTVETPLAEVSGRMQSLDAIPDGTFLFHSVDSGDESVTVFEADGTERYTLTGIQATECLLTADGELVLFTSVPKVDNELDRDLRAEVYDVEGERVWRGILDLPMKERFVDVARDGDHFVVLGFQEELDPPYEPQEVDNHPHTKVLVNFDLDQKWGTPLLFDPGYVSEDENENVVLYAVASHEGTVVATGSWGWSYLSDYGSYQAVLRDDVLVAHYFWPQVNLQEEVITEADFAPNGELYTVAHREYGETRLTRHDAALGTIWQLSLDTDAHYLDFFGPAYGQDVAATSKGVVMAGGVFPGDFRQITKRGALVWSAEGCTSVCDGDALVARVDDDTVLVARPGSVSRLDLVWPEEEKLEEGEGCSTAADCISNSCCKALYAAAGECGPADGCQFLSSCEHGSECSGGVCSVELGHEPSYCTAECESDGDCEAEGECIAVTASASVCLSACTIHEDCTDVFGEGWKCVPRTDVDGVDVTVCEPPPDAGGEGGAGGVGSAG